MGFVTRKDRVRVLSRVLVYVGDGLVQTRDHADRHAQPQIFLVPVLRPGHADIKAGGISPCKLVATYLDAVLQ